MKLYDPDLLDPRDGITAEDIERALDGYPATFQRDAVQDDLAGAAAFAFTAAPNTPKQALAKCRDLRLAHTFVGVGMCLRENRELLNIAALWPDAATAGEHGAPAHHFEDLTQVPRGMDIFWYTDNSEDPGHVAESIGGGLCNTTDFHESGFWGVALISRLAEWCGDPFRGGREVLNGVDYWPDPVKPKPMPLPLTIDERLHAVERRIHELHDLGREKRAARFELWADQLRAKQNDRR